MCTCAALVERWPPGILSNDRLQETTTSSFLVLYKRLLALSVCVYVCVCVCVYVCVLNVKHRGSTTLCVCSPAPPPPHYRHLYSTARAPATLKYSWRRGEDSSTPGSSTPRLLFLLLLFLHPES